MNRIEELLLMESTSIDFKEALEEKKPRSWLKSISAFANGIGGSLLYGIENDTKMVKGIDDIQELGEKISRLIENHLVPLPVFELIPHVYDGKNLLEVQVKSGANTPYYVEIGGTKEPFIRNGNDSLPAPDHMLHELILKGSHQSYDSLVSNEKKKDYSFTLFEATYLEKTGSHVEPSDYVSFGLATLEGYLTNAGKLLADQHIVFNSRIFCTRWSGNEKGSIFEDAKDDKEFEGNLIQLKKNASDFVKTNSKVRFQKEAEYRVEKPDYAERAVNEAIVNALIHRSYLFPGSEIHIDIYDDRLEIVSPGGLVDGSMIQSKDIFNIESQRRNPVIADLFHRMKFMERRGSGLRDIINETAKLPGYSEELQPMFISSNSSFKVIIKNVNYLNEPTNVLINEPIKLPPKQQMVYDVIRGNPGLRVPGIVEKSGLTKYSVKHLLIELQQKELVEFVGANKEGGYYVKMFIKTAQ